MSPVARQSKSGRIVHPCGRCPACLKRKRNDWITRFNEEMKKHDFCQFVTLTYDDDHLPLSPCDAPTLDKRHLQAFFKALRKEVDIKYYAIGEYGPNTFRPHYHALIWSSLPHGTMYELVRETWHHGNIRISPVVAAQLGYVANYHIVANSLKQWLLEEARAPEFTLSSKHLGDPTEEILERIARDGYHTRQGYKYSIPRKWIDMLDGYSSMVLRAKQQQWLNDKIEKEAQDDLKTVRQRDARREHAVNTFVRKTRKNRK